MHINQSSSSLCLCASISYGEFISHQNEEKESEKYCYFTYGICCCCCLSCLLRWLSFAFLTEARAFRLNSVNCHQKLAYQHILHMDLTMNLNHFQFVRLFIKFNFAASIVNVDKISSLYGRRSPKQTKSPHKFIEQKLHINKLMIYVYI